MALLKKMHVQGIRSFGPGDKGSQNIEFYTPLTLILGENGCGKTTIIECLKYAITGEFPPGTDRGRSFIHDPKIAGHAIVTGQVKLQFTDHNGRDIVTVSRSITSTQKEKTLTIKTLDSTIRRKNTETDVTADISSKCIDISAAMAQCFAVSKPVMEYVILCHQEDSNWPLDEGKKVKDRFDAIFNATKYIKCLDAIRKHAKELKIQSDKCLVALQYLKTNKQVSETKKIELTDKEKRLQACKTQISDATERLAPLIARIEEVNNLERNILVVKTNIETKKNSLDHLRREQDELKSKMEYEFDGSEEDLKQMISTFSQELEKKKVNARETESELKSSERIEKTLSEQLTKLRVELGKLQLEKTQHDSRVDERDRLLHTKAGTLVNDLPKSGPLDPNIIQQALSALQHYTELGKQEEEKVRTEGEKKEEAAQAKINTTSYEKAQVDQEVSSKQKQITDTNREVRELSAKLSQVDASAGELRVIESRLKRLEEDLQYEEDALDAAACKLEICRLQEDRRRVQTELQTVNKELEQLQQQQKLQDEIDILEADRVSKEDNSKRLLNKIRDELLQLLPQIPPQNLKFELQSRLTQLNREVKTTQSELTAAQKSLSTLEADHKHQREQIQAKEKELSDGKDKLAAAFVRQDLEQELENVKEQLEKHQKERGTYNSSDFFYKRYIDKLRERKPCCPLCHRGFDSSDDSEELITELEGKLAELPTVLQESERKVKQFSDRQSTLLQLKPLTDIMKVLETETIPRLKTKLADTQQKLSDTQNQVQTLQDKLHDCAKKHGDGVKIQGDASVIDQQQAEVRKLQQKLEILKNKLTPALRGSTRTLQQTRDDQERLNRELNTIQKKLEDKQDALNNHTDRVQTLRTEVHEQKQRKLQIDSDLQKQQQLEEKRNELEALGGILQEELEVCRDKLGPLQEQLAMLQSEKDTTRREVAAAVKKAQEEVLRRRSSEQDVRTLHKHVQQYENSGRLDKLRTVDEQRDANQTKLDKHQESQSQCRKKLEQLKNDIAKQQVRERELSDNLSLIRKRKEQTKLESEVKVLETQLGGLNPSNVSKERNKLSREEEIIQAEIHKAEGRKRELNDAVKDAIKELQRSDLRLAGERFTDEFVKSKTISLARDDLSRYAVALDWAVMHFHKERMNTINGILRELWQSVYKGTDIEYIQIRTDESDSKGIDKRRSYNYRVVMMKNRAEVDMRGRCSAGQKVLASLLIRMSLAEIFSTNCGILTLDEPTTNLDKKNVDSLSSALQELVNRRSSHRQFQLVVISHDENFVHNIAHGLHIGHVLTVGRDKSTGHSVIKKTRG